MLKERIAWLLSRYMDNSCTAAEEEEFLRLVSQSGRDEYLLELLEKAWQEYVSGQPISEEASNRIFQDIISSGQPPVERLSNTFSLFKSTWVRYAAVLFLVVGMVTFLYRKKHSPQPVARVYVKQEPVKNDVLAPDSVHATIITESGKRIVLDDMKDGVLSGNLRKVSNDNIVYDPEKNDRVEYNTLSVPRGSKVISITLSDASKVWLNAGSSLTYPTVFTGNKRLVKITGEAYFEITSNTAMPFTVEKDDARIQVLGTHFNVNAYDDEATIRVTLLKGAVKVSRGEKAVTLTPGQQAQLSSGGGIQLTGDTDLDEVMAWKMGRFVFNDADIRSIMRQVMKWYDVDVAYEGGFSDRRFTADISRNTNLSELLKVLELSNISFQLEGKKIIVKP